MTQKINSLEQEEEQPWSAFPKVFTTDQKQCDAGFFYLRKFPLGICCHRPARFSLQSQTTLKVTLCAERSCREAIHWHADFHSTERVTSHFSTLKWILYMGGIHPTENLLESFGLWSITIKVAQKCFKEHTYRLLWTALFGACLLSTISQFGLCFMLSHMYKCETHSETKPLNLV